jgi:Type I phosphodiesterase / nucleotide pyrophosphatase
MKTILLAAIFAVSTSLATLQKPIDDGDRVVLITLDGARHQEMFGGLDRGVLESTLKPEGKLEEHETYKRFWAESADERRRKLMPFFWGTLMASSGSIAGNRALKSAVALTNTHWFSYPGYAEILLGEAHDDTIKSNDPIRNPYTSVLEELRRTLKVPRERVATFASWDVFNAIVEHEAGATHVDAGPDESNSDAGLRELIELQKEAAPPWGGIRYDIFTFKLAMAHLAAHRPRVLYLAFDETDDWAHDGRYDRVLDAYWRTDRYLEQLWTWLQSQPDYRGRTHILITTDHGRGRTPADWRNHGVKAPGSDEVWMAFISPRMARRGEWRDHAPLATNQVASTLAQWLGLDWKALHPAAGSPIK